MMPPRMLLMVGSWSARSCVGRRAGQPEEPEWGGMLAGRGRHTHSQRLAPGQQPLTHTVTRVECISMSANWRNSAAVSSGLHSSVALVSSGLPCEGSGGKAPWVRRVQPGYKPGWASPQGSDRMHAWAPLPTPTHTFESMRLSWPTAQGRHGRAACLSRPSWKQAPNGTKLSSGPVCNPCNPCLLPARQTHTAALADGSR